MRDALCYPATKGSPARHILNHVLQLPAIPSQPVRSVQKGKGELLSLNSVHDVPAPNDDAVVHVGGCASGIIEGQRCKPMQGSAAL